MKVKLQGIKKRETERESEGERDGERQVGG